MRKYLVLFAVCSYSIVSIGQNVGVGVSSPQNKLHVGGGFRLDTLSGVGGPGLLWHNPSGVVYGIKFTGNANDVLRGDGTFGAFSANGTSFWSANGTHIYNNNTGNVGIGTTTPGSGLELSGTGLQTQQRITDIVSGNSLVLQGGPGNNLKITGYNYTTNTAQPLYLSVDGANTFINPGIGSVGIGTTTPSSKLTVYSNIFGIGGYGIEHTDGARRVSTFLNSDGGWFGTRSNHPLHFYTNGGNQQMTLTQAGQLGIGTTTPLGGYFLDVAGPVRSFGNSTHFVAQTTGGTNSWARYYMRSGIGANAQSWFMGTSQNFNGNQLYIADETFNQTRLSIQPNGGPINVQGNTTQNLSGYGLPKAMLYIRSVQVNAGEVGEIVRCYNGVTGGTTNGCGFSVTYNESNKTFAINLGFSIDDRFIVITPFDKGGSEEIIKRQFYIANNSGGNMLYIHAEHQVDDGSTFISSESINMMIIIY